MRMFSCVIISHCFEYVKHNLIIFFGGDIMATKSHLERNKRYLAKQDNIIIRVPKGKKAVIQEHAQKQAKSLNKYIVDLIDEDMRKE